ncbi:MAG: NAD-dependent succinate-semialdehyde dehydrogenase [Cyclobacteriaceae bacterium]|nr:NAD-dependent succinate-semialdehyde dehydrogenase [Cyclobacteriaceae bacterium]
MKIQSINPATGETIQSYTLHTDQEVSDKIDAVHNAWLSWKESSSEQRSELLNKMADVLISRKTDLAKLMAVEMGKPVTQGIAEVEKCASVCRYYANHASEQLADKMIETEASKSFVSFKPIGVVLAVMPWNYPFWQVFRFLAPALAAGNCGVLKHASNVPGCALAIEDIVKQAGFPEHVFNTLLISSDAVEKVIEHTHIQAVTLTGSNAAGSKVAQKAGELIKKTVLELGGSDAYVVLEDADLELAVKACVEGRLLNSGQSCIAAKRFIVVKPLLETFTEKYIGLMRAKIMGDPLDEKTEVGPQARVDLRNELHKQVTDSIRAGAVCRLGGKIEDEKTAFYPPTVLTNVKKGMPAFDEELFGPVAAIIEANDEAHAISLANDSVFGLGGAIFTKDVKRGEHIATNLMQSGSCFVNAFVKSDPRLPFGGIKQSGYGRELGIFGIREFVNIKTVYIR